MATAAIERAEGKQVRNARLELNPRNYDRLKAAAAREDRSIAAFVRVSVLSRIADSERAAESGYPINT